MPVSLKDIARKIGKSTTTVSRALNDYDDISAETKALVRQAAEELGYHPNTLAQRLKKQTTETLGLIFPTFGPRFSDPFFSEFLAGIGNTAARHNYDLLVSTRQPGQQEMQAYRYNVESQRIDGFIIVRTRQQDPRIEYLRQIGFPFVAFGRTCGDLDYAFVDEDGEFGMGLVVEHLVRLGHRRIACILPPSDLTFTQHRLTGIQKKCQELGLSSAALTVVESDLTQKGGYQKANDLLDLQEQPTAILCCNDLMAFGAMSAIQDRGLVVGRDISVAGFDNIPMAEYSHPPLTTINQPIYQIGGMVCDTLIKQIWGETQEPEQVILNPLWSSANPPAHRLVFNHRLGLYLPATCRERRA